MIYHNWYTTKIEASINHQVLNQQHLIKWSQLPRTSPFGEAYILPLLPSAPSYIHNLHFKLELTPECYVQLNLHQYNINNKGKHHYENIGSVAVDYTFYSNGTVDVAAKCSSDPFRLSNDTELARLIAFFGQLRDRLILLLADIKEQPHCFIVI